MFASWALLLFRLPRWQAAKALRLFDAWCNEHLYSVIEAKPVLTKSIRSQKSAFEEGDMHPQVMNLRPLQQLIEISVYDNQMHRPRLGLVKISTFAREGSTKACSVQWADEMVSLVAPKPMKRSHPSGPLRSAKLAPPRAPAKRLRFLPRLRTSKAIAVSRVSSEAQTENMFEQA